MPLSANGRNGKAWWGRRAEVAVSTIENMCQVPSAVKRFFQKISCPLIAPLPKPTQLTAALILGWAIAGFSGNKRVGIFPIQIRTVPIQKEIIPIQIRILQIAIGTFQIQIGSVQITIGRAQIQIGRDSIRIRMFQIAIRITHFRV